MAEGVREADGEVLRHLVVQLLQVGAADADVGREHEQFAGAGRRGGAFGVADADDAGGFLYQHDADGAGGAGAGGGGWVGHGRSSQTVVKPPSTTSAAPVMYEASVDARKVMAAATSAAVPARPNGVASTRPWEMAGSCGAVSGGSIRPGWTLLQRIPALAKLAAALRV